MSGEIEETSQSIKQIELIVKVKPEIIYAIENVPFCRKCCNEFIRNNDENAEKCYKCCSKCCNQCCIKIYECSNGCFVKWIECGKNEDDKCISCCKINFGELLQSRCPPCFEWCNKRSCAIGSIFVCIFLSILSFVFVPTLIIVLNN